MSEPSSIRRTFRGSGGTDTVKALMLTADGTIITTHADVVNAERLLEAQKRARKSLLLQFAKLKTGTTDEWEVIYSLPTPIFVNGVQVA
jgi:hypothetical protein